MRDIEVRVEKAWYRNCFEVVVLQRLEGGRVSKAEPLTMKVLEENEVIGDPSFTLGVKEAQLLVDELWRCGLRPSEGSGSAGSLAATERHLKDMQTITMGLLKKDGVGI